MSGGLYERRVVRVPDAQPVTTPPCQVCHGSQARARFAIEGLEARLVVCEGCGLGSLFPLPTPAEVASFYPDDYYGSPGQKFEGLVELAVRLVGARQARFLSAELSPGDRVLDVGCGRGVLLSELADRGLEVHGVEISAAAAEGADPRARIEIAPELSDVGYPPESFDLILIWHVLEHLRAPRATLQECWRILRPGGRLVVAVPNFGSLQARWAGEAWFHLDPPRHLYHFPLTCLEQLYARSGFEVTAVRHFSLRQNPFGWVQSALNRGSGRRNLLYQLLHSGEQEPQLEAGLDERLWQRLAYLAGMPLAVGLSVLAAACGSGASVTVVGTKR